MPNKTDQAKAADKDAQSKLPDLNPGKPVSYYLKKPLIIERKKEAIPPGTKIGEIMSIGSLSPLQLCDLVRSGRATLTPPETDPEDEDGDD